MPRENLQSRQWGRKRELQENIREAVRCHFGPTELPRAFRQVRVSLEDFTANR